MKKKEFDQILMRLKAQLNISQNKKIASLLGMTYDGFYARRQRDSFPEEKLRILSEQRPELKLDVEYILTGVSRAKAGSNMHMATVAHTAEANNAGYQPHGGEAAGASDDIGDVIAHNNKLIREVYEQLGFEPPFAWSSLFQELLLRNHIDVYGIKCVIELLREKSSK